MKPITIISLALNAFFILSAILFTCFFWDLDVSSAMGDSIGGTLGPLINIVAIFYIYKTYNDQRHGLILQQQSLQNEQKVAMDQMSIALHSDVSSAIKEVEQMFQNLTLTIFWNVVDDQGNSMQKTYNGRQALLSFARSQDLAEAFSKVSERRSDFLIQCLQVFSRFRNAAIRKRDLVGLLSGPHNIDLDNKINNVMTEFGLPIASIFRNITILGEMFPPQNAGNERNHAANTIMRYIIEYQTVALDLENLGYLVRAAPEPAVDAPLFDLNPQILVDEELMQSIDWNLEYQNR